MIWQVLTQWKLHIGLAKVCKKHLHCRFHVFLGLLYMKK
jgi:hypothetical protein